MTPSRLTMHGNKLDEIFPPPRWIKQRDDLIGIGGLRGLFAVATELKRWCSGAMDKSDCDLHAVEEHKDGTVS